MAKPRVPKKAKNGAASDTEPKNIEVRSESVASAANDQSAAVLENANASAEPKSKPTRTVRKPEIVRSANLLPINLDEEIRRLAYLMSERRGFAPGHENEDWLAAELEIRERYHQPKSKSASA